ncbi:hypothetical protein HDU89_005604 [Geranomyces variabilis]|nr:hypothetical protein HDU89_005604 [Geranomyces variabilis]
MQATHAYGYNVSLFVDANKQRFDVKVKLTLGRNAVFMMAPGCTVHIDQNNDIIVLDNVLLIVEEVNDAGHRVRDLGVSTPVVAYFTQVQRLVPSAAMQGRQTSFVHGIRTAATWGGIPL